MIPKQLLFALAVSASFLGSATAKGTNNGNSGSTGSTAASSSSLTLDSNLVQTGSQQTGGDTAGETASATSVNHSISYVHMLILLQRQCQLYQLLSGKDLDKRTSGDYGVLQWYWYVLLIMLVIGSTLTINSHGRYPGENQHGLNRHPESPEFTRPHCKPELQCLTAGLQPPSRCLYQCY